jgi:hypothetical protein
MTVLFSSISQHSDGIDFPNKVKLVILSLPDESFSVQQRRAGMPFVTSGKLEEAEFEDPSNITTVRTYAEINSCGF